MSIPESTERVVADAADLSQIIELMTTDKSNDWTEEIAVLVDLERQLLTPPVTVADLDGTADATAWIQRGHVLDDLDVAYLRALIIPVSSTTPLSTRNQPFPPLTVKGEPNAIAQESTERTL